MLVLLARLLPGWRDAVLVKPETILRWHRESFRLLWRWKSKQKNATSKLPVKTILLIRRMAEENRLWGSERIRGELLKLGMRVAKRTVQRYMRVLRRRPRGGQTWATFLANHRHQVWACDFLQTYDLWFRPIFAFFIIDHGSRKVVHVGVTREPNSTWTAQQMRNATPSALGLVSSFATATSRLPEGGVTMVVLTSSPDGRGEPAQPTFACLVVVTCGAPPPLKESVSVFPEAEEDPQPPPEQLGAGGQLAGGGLICVAVKASIESKSTSALRPTVTVP